MDFGNAALLSLVVFVLVEVVKQLAPEGLATDARFVLGSAVGLGIVAAVTVAQTAWGHEQVVGGKPLDQVNTISQVVVGVLLGAGAVGIHKVLGAVSSIGENPPE